MPPLSRRSSARTDALDCFAIAAPGLEGLVASELRSLGIDARAAEGGAAWRGDLDTLYRANLWLRTASRVVVRLGEFHVRGFAELERQARRLPWEQFVAPGTPVRFRVTSKKSRLYHTEAVAQRLAGAIERAVGASSAFTSQERDDVDDTAEPPAEPHADQLFVVRLHRDVCTVSADSSGALLHRRGYRLAVAKAPLRETLAAAVLLGSGWTGETPLVDPLCGSGTLPIEAALIARRIAPGLHRRFACLDWPGADRSRWAEVHAAAEAEVRPRALSPVLGSDRDEGAIAAARGNAARAGVADDVDFSVRSLTAIEPPAGPGTVVANPPYGLRIGELSQLRNLYAQLGHVLRRRCPGWTVAILSPDERLDRQLEIDLTERLRTMNGGIPVRLMTGIVPAAETGG